MPSLILLNITYFINKLNVINNNIIIDFISFHNILRKKHRIYA